MTRRLNVTKPILDKDRENAFRCLLDENWLGRLDRTHPDGEDREDEAAQS